MNQNNNSELLHYKRGMYYVNKLMNIFPSGFYIKESEIEFVKKETIRWYNNDIAIFDLNNFKFLCTIALMGLNKENIEKENKTKNYKYKIDYNVIDHSKLPLWSLKLYKEFDNTRIIQSDYDDWLSISHINVIDKFNYNYLFNVRNSLMHSEYNFDLIGYHGPDIANLTNSNYSGFCAKILISQYYEFIKHYFSNDKFFGIVSNVYTLGILNDKISINNYNELLDFIAHKITVNKIEYDNKITANKIYEKTVFKNDEITDYDIKKHKFNKVKVNLSTDDIEQIVCIIDKYYGESFYKLSNENKKRTLLGIIKYILDSKSIISSWILHFYRLTVGIPQGQYNNDDFVSLFAMEDSLLILKSYLILYRLQNKELQKYTIDYNLINEFNFDYALDDYNNYKFKMINKEIIMPEDKYKVCYFIELFRNALAHGNIKIFYKKENDVVNKYFQFNDEWKNKKRNVILSIDSLKQFLSSESFDSKYLNENIVKGTMKR